MTFAAPDGFDFDAFVALIGQRLGLVPRWRQKVREVPAHLGLPVWVDDADFDLDYHVRHSALPAPGTDEQLRALVGRLLGRRLDRSRPLWEIYLVEGLANGRFAVVTKTHHAMVDGLASMDVGELLLDPSPQVRETPPDDWRPAPEPSSLDLAADAVREAMRRPRTVLDVAARAGADVREVMAGLERTVETLVSATSGRPVHPLNAVTGAQRRYGMARTTLADHRAVRAACGGTVNDVVLAVVTGALRRWMMTRGEPLTAGRRSGRSCPSACGPAGARAPASGNSISAYFVDLPVGEDDPLRRLARALGGDGRAQGQRARGGRDDADPPRRPGPADPAQPRACGWPASSPATPTTCWSRTCPGRRVRSTRWAPGCSTCTRWCRSRAARRCRSGSPPTTAACTTGSTRTATRCPTSTCWPRRCPRRWPSCGRRGRSDPGVGSDGGASLRLDRPIGAALVYG